MKNFGNIRELIEASAVRFSGRTAFRIKIKTKEKGVTYRDVTYSILKDELKDNKIFYKVFYWEDIRC